MMQPLAWTLRSKSPCGTKLFGTAKCGRRKSHRTWGDGGVACLERVEERVLLTCVDNTAPEIANLGQETIFDAAGYGSASFINGMISDQTHESSAYYLDVDFDANGTVDATGNYSFSEREIQQTQDGTDAISFAVRVPGSYADGATVKLMVREYNPLDSDGNYWAETGWSAVLMTKVPSQNDPPEIKFAAVTDNGYGSPDTVWGEFRDYTPQGPFIAELDSNGDDVADQPLGVDRGAFSFSVWDASAARVRIRELAAQELDTDWFPVGSAQPPNNAPTFGVPGSTTLSWLEVEDDPAIGSVTATDPDSGDTLKYSITESAVTGSETFYSTVPHKGVSIDSAGAITVADSSVIQAAFEASGKYTFTIVVDDGQTTATTSFTIYDDWTYWIQRQRELVNAFALDYSRDIITGTAHAAESAANAFHAFLDEYDLGWDDFSSFAEAANTVIWATAVEAPAAAAAGEAIGALVLGLIGSGVDGEDATFSAQLTDWVNSSIQDSGDQLTHFIQNENDSIDLLEARLDRNDDAVSPDALAQSAYQQYIDMKAQLRLDLIAPTLNQIFGQMLYDYAIANGMELHVDGHYTDPGTCTLITVWASYDFAVVGLDGHEVADKLNELHYGSE